MTVLVTFSSTDVWRMLVRRYQPESEKYILTATQWFVIRNDFVQSYRVTLFIINKKTSVAFHNEAITIYRTMNGNVFWICIEKQWPENRIFDYTL